ncbi:MAG TPA: methyltransferase [Caldilineaceae bacterium]|nr:methyltransferase [Caldilineaceae bacterium]
MIAILYLLHLYLLGCAAVFGTFIWATNGHFLQGTKTTATYLIYLFSVATFVFGAVSAFMNTPTPWQIGLGFLLSALGTALFFWTIHTTRARGFYLAYAKEYPTAFVNAGPYLLVRHPFYVAYLLFWLGMLVAAPWWPTLGCLLILLYLYVVAARGEELKFEQSEFAEEYGRYKDSVGFMMPIPWR